tara:strand:+ start:312 stop:524 length:213 start_codon:yes stop_codon:yes gene_type:complete
VYSLQTPKLCLVTWYIFIAKKISKNVDFKNKKPITEAVPIIKGKDISVIRFFLINFAFALLRKNGHVAPK